jgi:uncharacterized delta-60 repeat protein
MPLYVARYITRLLYLAFICSIIASTARVPAITPDPAFGVGGKKTVDFPSSGSTYSSQGFFVFAQPSGRIVGLGRHSQPGSKGNNIGIAAAGLTETGSIDTDFSGGRTLDIQGIPAWHTVFDAHMLSDGRILRLTQYRNPCCSADGTKLVRLGLNGGIDTSYNPNLRVNPNEPGFMPAPPPVKFSVFPDESSFVVVNQSSTYYVIHVLPDGTRDMAFGIQGAKALTALNRLPGRSISDTIALPNGKFVIGGTFYEGTQIFVARLNSDGNMDYSFGRGGVMRVRVPGLATATMRAMMVQGDKYILAGSIQDPDIDVFMIRATARGRLDVDFGEGGMVRSDFTPDGSDFVTAAALDANGKIIIAGEADQDLASPSNFLAARYSADGVLEDNEQTFFTPDFDAGAAGLCIQPDGKIVLIGYARNPNASVNGSVFAVARYND